MVDGPGTDHCRCRAGALGVAGTLLALALLMAGCSEFDYAGDRQLRQAESSVAVDGEGTHRVESGDTLYQIAWRYGLDFRDLARWNDIAPPYVIYPGQILVLNGSSQPARVAGAERAAPSAEAPAGTPKAAPAAGPLAWRWPVEGRVVRQYDAGAIGKRGIGIAAEPGSDVAAAAPGQVVYSGDGLRGYGNLIIIKHNERFLTAYGYNRELLVGEGEQVSGGQAIARVGGSANRNGELHFEIRQQGDPVNPLNYLP